MSPDYFSCVVGTVHSKSRAKPSIPVTAKPLSERSTMLLSKQRPETLPASHPSQRRCSKRISPVPKLGQAQTTAKMGHFHSHPHSRHILRSMNSARGDVHGMAIPALRSLTLLHNGAFI